MSRLAWLLIGWCLFGAHVSAQRATAIVERAAPIYIKSTDTRAPLRTLPPGTAVRVLAVDSDWVNVQFRDPQFGDRIGWVRRELLRMHDPATAPPLDLSVSEAAPEAPAVSRPDVASPPSAVLPSLGRLAAGVQRQTVQITDQRRGETSYSYVVPAHFSQQTDANANCAGFLNTANCSASSTTRGIVAPPQRVSYSVTGATFTLRLADGRLVVVNCDSKYRLQGHSGNRRSCRVPLVDDIVVEFKGDDAKLFWAVSIDGSKSQSETYKILGVLAP